MNEKMCSSCGRPTCAKELVNYGGQCEDCAAGGYQATDASPIGKMLKDKAKHDNECGGGKRVLGQAEGGAKTRS